MEQDVQERFEALVDRSGDHHLWTGATHRSRKTGRVKVQGREITAHRLAWVLANGPLSASVKVLPCPDVPACVRVDHLRVDRAVQGGKANRSTPRRGHGRRGGGSMQQRRPGVWKLTVTTLPDEDGNTRRIHRTVSARTAREATEELARFVDEVRSTPVVVPKEDHRLRMDDAVERFLCEHLRDERGREEKTIRDYRALHQKWFAPELGRRLVRDVDRAAIDRAFGKMRRAGLSRSRLNQAKSLYAPFFNWA